MGFPVDPSATITLPLMDFRRIEREFAALRDTIEQTTGPVAPAIPATATDVVAALEAALPIVQFAVANVPPHAVYGWPQEALTRLADAIAQLFPENADRQVLAITFREFARECMEIELHRSRRQHVAAQVSQMASKDANSDTDNA